MVRAEERGTSKENAVLMVVLKVEVVARLGFEMVGIESVSGRC